MAETGYQGWTNYETWDVHLWLTNDESSYRYCRELAADCAAVASDCDQVNDRIWTVDEASRFLLADRLRELIEEMNPLREEASMFSDILTAAVSEVNWTEIAEAFLEE